MTTRIFCGLSGIFSLTVCPILYIVGWGPLTAVVSKAYLILLIPATLVMGAVFVHVAAKASAPEWWTKWFDPKEFDGK